MEPSGEKKKSSAPVEVRWTSWGSEGGPKEGQNVLLEVPLGKRRKKKGMVVFARGDNVATASGRAYRSCRKFWKGGGIVLYLYKKKTTPRGGEGGRITCPIGKKENQNGRPRVQEGGGKNIFLLSRGKEEGNGGVSNKWGGKITFT